MHDDAALALPDVAPPRRAWPGVDPLVSAIARVGALLAAERDRWFLWLPVLLGIGIGFAFGQPRLPAAATGHGALLIAAVVLGGAWWAAARDRTELMAVLIAAGALVLGFGLAIERTYQLAAPLLDHPGVYDVQGRIVDIEELIRGRQITLDQVTIARLAPEATPLTVRANLRGGPPLAMGDVVAVRARLQAPMGPAVPGGFDYGRQAWFQQLGGLGFALGAPRVVVPTQGAWSLALAQLRSRMSDRITDLAPGEAGAVTAALLTGVRAALSQALWRDFQVSGLAHILSISGLHMVLVAGVILTVVRYAVALVPPLALRVTARKVGAATAIVGTGFYTLLAGSSVPAERSFMMIAVGLLGVIAGRDAISMRVLAWAALVVLVWQPECLFGASFQLSFAAVAALIAAYELPSVRNGLRSGSADGVFRRMVFYVAGICATTLIASIATAPLGAYHFQTVPTYGVLANLIAVPVTTFWVMPAGMLSMLLMPVGLDAWTVPLTATGVNVVLWTAHMVAGLPGASLGVGQLPHSTLVLFGLGGAWLCLWRQRWRWLGAIPIVVSLTIAVLHPPPDLLISPKLDMVAARLESGATALVEWHGDGLIRDFWRRALGLAVPLAKLKRDAEPFGGLACDRAGCVLQQRGQAVALARRVDATVEDCRRATLVIASNGYCAGPARFIGRNELLASQGLAVRLGSGTPQVETVAAARGDWPWSQNRRRQ